MTVASVNECPEYVYTRQFSLINLMILDPGLGISWYFIAICKDPHQTRKLNTYNIHIKILTVIRATVIHFNIMITDVFVGYHLSFPQTVMPVVLYAPEIKVKFT